ncbi:SprT family protein [Bacillus sp. 03113]|uniref:SprT family protein n=1 Tax=Bacillus sp. 03113 TaxID=2578211 RepID=UPI00114245BF|nr:SprT family protein [Bacillus sp. 03113]
MDNEQLQLMVEEISSDYFSKPFIHKAYFNDRLRTTGGRYMLQTHNIEINKKYYVQFGRDELEGIIKHELCHYHLHIEKKGYRHKDHDFKSLMKKVGAPRYCSTLPGTEKRIKRGGQLIYACKKCHQIYKRTRKVNTKKYVCGHCKGALVLISRSEFRE